MNLFKEILKIIALSSAIVLITFLITRDRRFSCVALEAVNGDTVLDFVKTISGFITVIAFWTTGFFIYFIAKRYCKVNWLLYFLTLSICTCYPFYLQAFFRAPEKKFQIKSQICSKTEYDEYYIYIDGLDYDEYQFLTQRSNRFPEVPKTTETLRIKYGQELLLGDYELFIDLKLQEGQALDTIKYPDWQGQNRYFRYHKIKHW